MWMSEVSGWTYLEKGCDNRVHLSAFRVLLKDYIFIMDLRLEIDQCLYLTSSHSWVPFFISTHLAVGRCRCHHSCRS